MGAASAASRRYADGGPAEPDRHLDRSSASAPTCGGTPTITRRPHHRNRVPGARGGVDPHPGTATDGEATTMACLAEALDDAPRERLDAAVYARRPRAPRRSGPAPWARTGRAAASSILRTQPSGTRSRCCCSRRERERDRPSAGTVGRVWSDFTSTGRRDFSPDRVPVDVRPAGAGLFSDSIRRASCPRSSGRSRRSSDRSTHRCGDPLADGFADAGAQRRGHSPR